MRTVYVTSLTETTNGIVIEKGITNKAPFMCLSPYFSLLLSTCHAGHPHTCLLYSLILTYRLFDLAHYNLKFSEKSSLKYEATPESSSRMKDSAAKYSTDH
jgi:hypothetical protein